ncbi:hypothetical protein I6F35_10125 [Bradyrhizobium sp. BRP22]|uniref:hypothetical protein n=1 Tax=Bradyrhizobium sp. BRP22 TaxID=2793821 RepID=UPI001CD5E815|nr:hypothetical protein [Bradyrhizobium sp. BRP22]MCA1453566.1 hypothetical protein [Bradyrhizobium sp. BRP22]
MASFTQFAIDFGRKRAKEGAGPATLAIDMSFIRTIATHAAARTEASCQGFSREPSLLVAFGLQEKSQFGATRGLFPLLKGCTDPPLLRYSMRCEFA